MSEQQDPAPSPRGQHPVDVPPPPADGAASAPLTLPRQIRLAVNMQFALVAIGLVNLTIALSRVADTAVVVAGAIFMGLMDVLYLWLALRIRKGSTRARTAITVLFIFGIVTWLVDHGGSATAVVKAIAGIQLVIMAAILVLLWQRPSSAYFAARSQTI